MCPTLCVSEGSPSSEDRVASHSALSVVRSFRRSHQPVEADADLPFLTVDDAQRVRALVSASFVQRGMEVVVLGDHVRDASQRQLGLWNVAAACHNDDRGQKAWPQVVDRHVHQILAAMDAPDPFESMADEELLAGTYLRLYEQQSIPDAGQYPHATFAPGLLEMLALDLPDSVAVMTHQVVTRLGGYASMRERGLHQLRAVPIDEHEMLDGPGGGQFHVVMGDSVYTGSLALILPEIAHKLTGRDAGPHGRLLSVPNRHQLVWHDIQDAGVIGALQGMATFTPLGFEDSPGPLSPHVYWWSGAEYHQLTCDNDDGSRAIQVEPEFQAVLEAVAH